MSTEHEKQAQRGATNLIRNCLGADAGQTLLIVGEEGEWCHYDRDLCDFLAQTARELGLKAEIVIAPQTNTAADVPAELVAAIAAADHTVFFARMADQLRFLGIPGSRSMFACYTQTRDVLADRFAQIDHRLMQEVYDRVVVAIEASQTCRIICPDGTDLQGAVSFPDGGDELTDFAVEPFPVMIFPPVDCLAMSGQLSLAHWLTSSSTNIYEGSVFTPRSPVMAQLEEGIITEFVGEAGEAARIKAHFERVGAMAGGNPFAVNSWHTGINPRNYSTNQPGQDLERWSNAVFGSPRFTHFHACGTDPGDIAISLFDATISFDGEAFWQDGRFAFLDWPEMQELLQRYPGNEDAFEMRWDIGFERSNAA